MKSFIIDHIDPLGQGVFKEGDQVYFIPKTLPGEEGVFKVVNSSKGVHFGELSELKVSSNLRIDPKCSHFEVCSGCSYLHTDYEQELKFKENHFKRMLEKSGFNYEKFTLLASPSRFHYRNRIQLHYDIKKKIIGYKKKKSKKIFPINNCLIADKKLQNFLQELLCDHKWLKLRPKKERPIGHLELSLKGDTVEVFWNQQYSSGGFTQVNPELNKTLKNELESKFSGRSLKILDLFGGAGNLVEQIQCDQKLSVDIYEYDHLDKNKFHLDLFSENAWEDFNQKQNHEFDTLFVDPPRSGFKDLEYWSKMIGSEEIFYLSCHPFTMLRDLKFIQDQYSLQEVYLIDFFPGTSHFEAAIYLRKN